MRYAALRYALCAAPDPFQPKSATAPKRTCMHAIARGRTAPTTKPPSLDRREPRRHPSAAAAQPCSAGPKHLPIAHSRCALTAPPAALAACKAAGAPLPTPRKPVSFLPRQPYGVMIISYLHGTFSPTWYHVLAEARTPCAYSCMLAPERLTAGIR